MVSHVCGVLDSDTRAEKLLLGTMAQETHMGTYKDPTEFRAGSGICQFDRIAFDDVKARTKQSRKALVQTELNINLDKVEYNMLEYNPVLSILFARLKYKLIAEEIPHDLEGQARYWKKYYNTEAGKGTVEEYKQNYAKFVL